MLWITILFPLLLNMKTMNSDNPLNTKTDKSPEVNHQLQHIRKLAAYNHWANEQFIDWLIEADSNQWTMNIQSSFSSLELTVRHLWNAEHGWLSTLKNETWSAAIDKDAPQSQKFILDGFLKTSLDFKLFVEKMSESSLLETRKIGKEGKEITLLEIIHHVYNHATYHRGQLTTMGRQAGMSSPPRTDFIFYVSK